MSRKDGDFSLDEYDDKVLLGLYRFRYLTVDLIAKSGEFSIRTWNRRLKELLRAGYIDRPPAQKWTYRRHERAIYALGQKGADYLAANFDIQFPSTVKWEEKNRRYRGQDPFSHALKTAQFLIELEAAIAQRGGRLSHQDELFGADYVTGVSWDTQITTENEMLTVKLKPDGVFSIHIPAKRYPMNFCLEIDRGTMPLKSSNFRRSSILKKYLSYADTHNRGLAKENFDLRNFRVLMVTTTNERADKMRSLWAEEVSDLPKMCLFSSFEVFYEEGVKIVWSDADGNRAQLL